ncbi:MAG: ABC transporter ATP-binding protein [Candidatus Bipolaricaulia bacterium]
MALLSVENLTMHYTTREGEVNAVDNVSFKLEQGEALGLVGESGCGKTSVALSILKLLPENARILGGHIHFDGTDLVPVSGEQMRKIRWSGISMIFQAAMNSLNPVYKVGDQIIEAIQTHNPQVTRDHARDWVAELFDLVGLAPERMDHYPHEYSGGMKQRAIIAMALACNPQLIIADEPTTALDVIIQDKILEELRQIQKRLNMSMIYISHDIAVIAEVCDWIGVMYAGKLVEFGDTVSIFENSVHPYTQALISAFPSVRGEKHELKTIPGEPPDLIAPPAGCRFHPRCSYATEICKQQVPAFEPQQDDQQAACWHPLHLPHAQVKER